MGILYLRVGQVIDLVISLLRPTSKLLRFERLRVMLFFLFRDEFLFVKLDFFKNR